MAERKSGPVKPPVIDLTARPSAAKPDPVAAKEAAAAGAQLGSQASSPPDAAAPQTPPEPSRTAAAGPAPFTVKAWTPLAIAAAGGAVLGTGLTFLLANVITLPSPTAPPVDPTPQLAAQNHRLEAIEQRLPALEALEPRLTPIEKTLTRTQVSLDATIAQLDAGLNQLRTSIGAVKDAIPAPLTLDFAGLDDQIKALRTRVDAIAAGASTADADAMAQNLAGLGTELNKLSIGLTGMDGRISALEARLTAMTAATDAVKAALAAHVNVAAPGELGLALKLPLVISGLDAAFGAGHPFGAELVGLGSVLPEQEISPLLLARAQSGLSRPDQIAARFAAILPDILAAGRTGSKGDWIADLTEWAKSLLALRPATEIEGDSPDAVVSRIEGALSRRDYGAAATLLAKLPEPMRLAAGTVADEIGARAAADALLAELRARAIAGPAT